MERPSRTVIAFRIRVRHAVPRVVLDTNLFVAAYWNPRSASARIIEACEEGRAVPLVSPAIRRELFRILHQARTDARHRARVADLLERAEEVHPVQQRRLVPDDPEDDKFLDCALEGDADFIITSDDHLLRLGRVEDVRVVKPGAALAELG